MRTTQRNTIKRMPKELLKVAYWRFIRLINTSQLSKYLGSSCLQIGRRANLIRNYSSKRAFGIENDEGFKEMSFRKQWLFWIDVQVAFQNRRGLALRLQAHPEKVSVEPRAGRVENERDFTRGVGTKNVLARPKINSMAHLI